jgi:hypothetical protein
MMRRKLTWIDQAEQVIKSELPPEFVDPNRPDLASVRWAARCIETFIVRTARTGSVIPILDERRFVRVWFEAKKTRILGFAIEASYDGGRSFEDPLLRYNEFTRKDEPPT